jgi:hypothetical protein
LSLMPPTNGASPHASSDACRKAAPDISLMARLLHSFLDFPLINGGEDAAHADREQLFELLRSWAAPATGAPVHFLCYPEWWSIHGAADRRSVHAKSNEFAQREGKPTLQHLLLPRTRGFNASLECLREAAPVVYDVTMVRVSKIRTVSVFEFTHAVAHFFYGYITMYRPIVATTDPCHPWSTCR